jgi:hypothetical protein
MTGAAEWKALLRACAAVFTRPSCLLFWTLVSAWVLCPGRRTVTRMIGVADPDGTHAHDAYHRFLGQKEEGRVNAQPGLLPTRWSLVYWGWVPSRKSTV